MRLVAMCRARFACIQDGIHTVEIKGCMFALCKFRLGVARYVTLGEIIVKLKL